jgi:hypothetical protein
MSVRKAEARAKVARFSLVTCENSQMTGFMVAAKGILSIMAGAKSDIHRIRGRSNFLERHSIHANSKRTAVRSSIIATRASHFRHIFTIWSILSLANSALIQASMRRRSRLILRKWPLVSLMGQFPSFCLKR